MSEACACDACTCLACRIERAITAEIMVDEGTDEFAPVMVINGCVRALATLGVMAESATPGAGEPLLLTIPIALARRYRAARAKQAAMKAAH